MLFNNLLSYGTWLRVPRGKNWGRVGTPVLGYLVLVPDSVNVSSSKTYVPAQDLLSNTTETQPSLARPICLRIYLCPALKVRRVRAFLQDLDTLLHELIQFQDAIISSSKIAASKRNVFQSRKKFSQTTTNSSQFNVIDRLQEQVNIIKRARGQEPLVVLECKERWTIYVQFFVHPESEEQFFHVREKCIRAIAKLKERFCSK
uniref:AlNc14C11G1312 protein n=1 Tax=Albugo laibachii Nc14 TaxID=890382 RepID=F0W2T0_9STRA|nr:AlNc14C11G1312 [Albugo laibachii Nc14]|eukprot:CCA15366.1 AlNc14C11G1312 [Albugo laibachii Nc14]